MDSAGVDVGARQLQVTLCREGRLSRRVFSNTPCGRKALGAWLGRAGTTTRVCLEATGSYGLDLALLLSGLGSIQVMVANPRAVRQFAAALMQRNKTDVIDADILQQFAARMPFQPWSRPSQSALQLRTIARRICIAAPHLCLREEPSSRRRPDPVHPAFGHPQHQPDHPNPGARDPLSARAGPLLDPQRAVPSGSLSAGPDGQRHRPFERRPPAR